MDELVPALARLAVAGLPIVITIEDLHLADESLVQLLTRLMSVQGARILVVSTAWRDTLDQDSRPAHRMLEGVEPDRFCRVVADEVLSDLAPSERREIVRSTQPGVSEWNASLLAARFPNPWSLQLASNVGVVRRAERNLTAEEVASLPNDIDSLFAQLWRELPADTRKTLMMAALCTPAGISESLGFRDSRWDSSLLVGIPESEAWLRASAGELSDVLGQSSDAYAWVRTADEWLRRFQDPDQFDVALGQAELEYDSGDRRSLYEAMARNMTAGAAESPAQELHQARLLVALASEGFLPWDETTCNGAVTLCQSLIEGPDVVSRRYVILIAESALRSTNAVPAVPGPLLTLRGQYGRALAESGRVNEALTTFEELLPDLNRIVGPDALETLGARHYVASSLRDLGRVNEALTAFEALLADETRVLGP